MLLTVTRIEIADEVAKPKLNLGVKSIGLALDASNLQVVGYEGGYCWIRVHASCELRLGQL